MDVKTQLEIIKKGVLEIISEEELIKKLEEKKNLKVKVGFDPTAPDLHLGHFVLLRKLKQFQDLGHEIYFIIGDFTAMIGDPTGRTEMRKPLSKEEVLKNAKTYQDQVFKVLDKNKTKILFNSSWFEKFSCSDLIRLSSLYTVARMLERDDFANRFRKNLPIGINEFLYPLLQGYDSVVISADIEIGGIDQKFNLLVGRHLQREFNQPPQVLIMLPLLLGTDGVRKMSKTFGNYIGITEPPDQIYGKIMSISDELMIEYFYLLTDFEEEEIKKIKEGLNTGNPHPMESKKRLAKYLVSIFYGEEEAKKAEERFETVHQKRDLSKLDIIKPKEVKITKDELKDGKIWICELMKKAGFISSFSEGKRLIKQKGVKIDGKVIEDTSFKVSLDKKILLQVGKKKFALVYKE